ncbi:MAG: SOS response-associated peptidase family protein [Usitatibacteraceae bacterium]
MCNHYKNDPEIQAELSSWREYISWSLDRPLPDYEADIWPKRQALIVRTMEGKAQPDTMAWGVPITLPGKRPGTTVTKQVTNVRNLSSSFWHNMLASPAQRCLVPFSSFAEPKPNAGREEVWFRLADARLGAFAGMWRASDAGNVFAFLTCEPNPLVAPIHPKAMPVILHPDDYQGWLDGEEANKLAVSFPSQLMEIAQ